MDRAVKPVMYAEAGIPGLAPRASETDQTDRKGQPMSKAGPSLLRATLFRAAGTARRQDPQLARIYYLQMTERGATHLKACCVVAGHLAERSWAVLNRGTPYVICDNNGTPVTAPEAKRSSRNAGPCPRTSANGGAAARQRGRPPRRPPGRTSEATVRAENLVHIMRPGDIR
jgi:hypothetical protein